MWLDTEQKSGEHTPLPPATRWKEYKWHVFSSLHFFTFPELQMKINLATDVYMQGVCPTEFGMLLHLLQSIWGAPRQENSQSVVSIVDRGLSYQSNS